MKWDTYLAMLGPAISLVNNIMGWVYKAKAELLVDTEATPEQDAEFQAEISRLKTAPEDYQQEQPL